VHLIEFIRIRTVKTEGKDPFGPIFSAIIP
jgi:hypothetical protein